MLVYIVVVFTFLSAPRKKEERNGIYLVHEILCPHISLPSTTSSWPASLHYKLRTSSLPTPSSPRSKTPTASAPSSSISSYHLIFSFLPESINLSMAFAKLIIPFILVSLLVLHQVQAVQTNHQLTSNAVSNTGYGPKMDCGAACAGRCQLSSRPRLCKRACGTCCVRCNCVPPGTSGNYEACPCYASLTTHGNRRKCP